MLPTDGWERTWGLLIAFWMFTGGTVAAGLEELTRGNGATNSSGDSVSEAGVESLEQAWTESLASARKLKAMQEYAESAHEDLLAAKSKRYPSVVAEGGYFWLDERPAAMVGLPGTTGLSVALDDEFAAGRVTATLPVFTSGQIRHGIGAGKAGWKAARAETLREVLDLKLSVAKAYVMVLRATRAVRVAGSRVTSLDSHFQTVSNFFAKGLVARNDLLASQVTLADARQGELQARNALDLAATGYNRFLQRPLTHRVSLKDLTPVAVPTEVGELTLRAFRKRPELVVLGEQVEGLREQAKGVRAGAWPSIGLSGSFLHLQTGVLERDHVWVAGVVARWNLLDGGQTRHKARAVDHQATAAAALRSEAMSAISLEVRGACLDVAETTRRMEVTRDAVGQAEENLSVAQDRYRAGTATNTEVLDAETLRVRSLGNHDTAIYDSVLAGIRLQRAIGEL